jgi:hypothetical protein
VEKAREWELGKEWVTELPMGQAMDWAMGSVRLMESL